MSVTGEKGRPPVRVGVSILDMGSGLWLALGVLAALRVRDAFRSGLWAGVSTSLLEVGAAEFMAYDVTHSGLTGHESGPRGALAPVRRSLQSAAADGYIAIGGGGDSM